MFLKIVTLLILLWSLCVQNSFALDLYEAAKKGRVSIVKELIQKGVDVNAKDESGKLAVEYAVEYNHPITARFLMQHMNEIEPEDMLALLWNKKYSLFKFYYDNNVHKYFNKGSKRSFLTTAAMYGDENTVLFLLKNNIDDINAKDDDGETPLIAAAYDFSGDSETSAERAKVIRILLKYKADINAKNNKGETALIKATNSMGSELIHETLLKGKADINARDNNGMTVLMDSVSHSFLGDDPEEAADTLVLLLKYKPSINIKDNDGKTALMYAARAGFAGAVKILLANGADLYLKDNNGNTALSYALFEKHKNTAEILMNADK